MTMKEDNFLSKAISKNISRRSFVKWSAAVGATASMSGLVVSSAAKIAGANSNISSEPATGGLIVDWIATHCLVCHGWCELAVGLDANDVVRKIEGCGGQLKPATNLQGTGLAAQSDGGRTNVHDDMYSRFCSGTTGYLSYHIHNRGRICAKGNDGMEHLYDPDRVKYPLQRSGDRGSGKWKRIPWSEAYYEIGKELRRIGKTNRNRVVFWVGRNEDHHMTDRFTTAYGTRNHIEHTSICESSRHTTQNLVMKDKFPLPSINTFPNSVAGVATPHGMGGGLPANWNLGPKDNVDLFVSIGGNHMESAIPMASYSQRLADVRRHGGRVVGIDVRQSNTMAWADQQIFIKPGTDAALAAGIIHTIMANYTGGTAALQSRINSRPNNDYVGLFAAEEGAGTAFAVGIGMSLESYLDNGSVTLGPSATNFGESPIPDGRLANVAFDKTLANTITGVSVANINYLAWAFSNNFGAGSAGGPLVGDPGIPTTGTVPPRNPVMDGYRGPSKHVNGSYNYAMLRALQYLAVGFDDGSAGYGGDGISESIKRAGGVDRPGGLNHNVWDSGVGGTGRSFGSTAGGADNLPAATQRIDNWDYTGNGGTKFKLATHKCDQYVIPGIRASIGLNPFIEGMAYPDFTTNTNPYGKDSLGNNRPGGAVGGGADDDNFIVEALLSFKNNPAYSRCNIALDRETFTRKNPADNSYLLKNYWTIDMNMGDASLYADIILPDASFLERFAIKDFESMAAKGWSSLRQPVRQQRGVWNGTTANKAGKALPLYECRSVWRILYELARAVESIDLESSPPMTLAQFQAACAGPDGDTPMGGQNIAPWSGTLFSSFNWSGADSDVADRDFCGNAFNVINIPGGAIGPRLNYMRTNGHHWIVADPPNWWRKGGATCDWTAFKGVDDPSAGETGLNSSGDFYGQAAIYSPITQAPTANPGPTAFPAIDDRPYYLTTYRVNVHTHARTASCPRLQEVLGSSWAVMSPTTAAGIRNTSGTVVGVQTGDAVRIYSTHHDITAGTKPRTVDIEVKVTPRAQDGVVSISHSQGHAIQSFGGDADGTGYDGYNVNNNGTTLKNRFHDRYGVASIASNDPSSQPTQAQILGTAMDDYRWNLKPSAPSTDGNALSTTGHGSHPNWVINRTSDPVGASMGFFDTPCDVRRI